MRIKGNVRVLAALAAAGLLTGCSGVNASKSVSPLDFLLPGAGSMGGGLMRGLLLQSPASTNAPVTIPALKTTPAPTAEPASATAPKQVAQLN